MLRDSAVAEAPFYPPRVTPPAKPLSYLRTARTFLRNPLETIPEAVYHEPMVPMRALRPVVWVTDPALVKAVLLDRRDEFPKDFLQRRILGPLIGNGILTAEGSEWRWQRQTVAPKFRHADMLDYVPAMVAGAELAIAGWRPTAPGTTHPVDRDMMRATYHVIANTVLAGGGEQVGAALERDAAAYGRGLQWSIAYAVMGLPHWVPRPLRRLMARREARVRGTVGEMIRARRTAAEGRDDLFDRLLDAAEPETGRRMSDQQLVDNLLTFLIAGHDTTAKALAWTLYVISRAPTWQERMLDEIRAVVPSGPIAGVHIVQLQTVQRVLKESMRLFPPVPVLTRFAAEDTEIGGQPIKAGTGVGVPVYVIHRHRALWDDADRFDPSRFVAEQEVARPRYQYMPFGGGPRVCVGASFAMIEATAILATLVRAARFDCPPGPEPVPLSRVVLAPRDGLPLRVTLRDG